MNQTVGGKGEGHNVTEEGRLMGHSNTTSNINSSSQKSFLVFESKALQVHACAWTLSGKQVSDSPCESLK